MVEPVVISLLSRGCCAVEDFLAHNSLSNHSAPRRVVDRVKPLDQLNDEVSECSYTQQRCPSTQPIVWSR